jgi:hypothetical protein
MRPAGARYPAVGTFLDRHAERFEQPTRRRRDVADGRLERVGVAARRRSIAADLSNELQGGRVDLAGRGGLIGTAELLDAATHDRRLARPAPR